MKKLINYKNKKFKREILKQFKRIRLKIIVKEKKN